VEVFDDEQNVVHDDAPNGHACWSRRAA
jgi:hypothetical protein